MPDSDKQNIALKVISKV